MSCAIVTSHMTPQINQLSPNLNAVNTFSLLRHQSPVIWAFIGCSGRVAALASVAVVLLFISAVFTRSNITDPATL